MPAHAHVRAAAGSRGRPALVLGRARAWAWVRVPYPAWFFLNRVSWVWVTSITATVATVEPNSCNGSDQTIATVGWVQTKLPLSERYK